MGLGSIHDMTLYGNPPAKNLGVQDRPEGLDLAMATAPMEPSAAVRIRSSTPAILVVARLFAGAMRGMPSEL
jgi:hypothetical protein